MNRSLTENTLTLLATLEAHLKSLSLWQSETPPAKALQSKMPFCFDTLTFQQWLQFVFIARIHLLIEDNQPLPNNMLITPIAEDAFKKLGADAKPLLDTLSELEQLLSEKIG